MKTRLNMAPIAILVVVGMIAASRGALAQSSVDVAVNQTASTACSAGESVALNGNLHVQVSAAADPNGGTRYEIGMSSSLTGVGQSTQASYSGSGSYGYGFTTGDSPAQVNLELGTPLKSQGSAPDLRLSQSVNITVDSSGSISASVISSSTDCAQ